ncbi:MAG: metalloregulator ArsR/SmtB family transcription factor [Pseudomonadota bacterium]|nr:metalloregulator ArsR/SmtB family transcription factor [Pseudomonadota bacterium]
MENIAQTFKALAEPVRLRIVNLLLNKESLCVCDLVAVLEIGQSTVSRHLAYLKNAGLVNAWREGTWMHYALAPRALDLLNLEHLQQQFAHSEQITTDNERLQQYQQTPRSCQI